MADSKRVETLVDAYAVQKESLLNRVTLALLSLWLPFGWWSKPDMVHAYARKSAMLADGGVAQARRLARAFAVEMLREADALPDTLPPIEDRYTRSNIDIEQVYARPARQRSWAAHSERVKELEQDEDEEDAEADAGSFWDVPEIDLPDEDDSFWTIPDEEFQERLKELIEDDLNRAANEEILRTFEASPKVTGYRRVIHPELSAGGSCGLCVVASTRMYYMEDLAAMHGHCKCTVLPVTADDDPGFTLHQDDLKKFYRDAGSNRREDLLNTRYKVEMHGELGPTIVSAEHHFRGTSEVNRLSGRVMARPWKRRTVEDEKAMWKNSAARAEEFNKRLAAKLANPSSDDLEVADIRHAMDFNRDFIAYASRRA